MQLFCGTASAKWTEASEASGDNLDVSGVHSCSRIKRIQKITPHNTCTCKHTNAGTHNVVKYHVEPLYQSQSVDRHCKVPLHQLCSLVTMGTNDPYGLYVYTSTTVLPQNLGNTERSGRYAFHGEVEKKSNFLAFSK